MSDPIDPEVVNEVVSDQDALVAGFYQFEEMIWKRINEQDNAVAKTAVATWVSGEMDRVQTQVKKEIDIVASDAEAVPGPTATG